jgi:hypothetical protein
MGRSTWSRPTGINTTKARPVPNPYRSAEVSVWARHPSSQSSGLRGANGGSGWESNPPLQVSTLQPDGFEGRASHQTRIASRG